MTMTRLTDEQIVERNKLIVENCQSLKLGTATVLVNDLARLCEAAVLAANPGVPREPTEAMQRAGCEAMFDKEGGDLKWRELFKIVRKGWRAMYDAATKDQPAAADAATREGAVGAMPERTDGTNGDPPDRRADHGTE